MGFKLTDRIGFSPPFQFTGVQEEGFYEGGIDYDKLVNKLAKTSRLPFDYNEFRLEDVFIPVVVSNSVRSVKIKNDNAYNDSHTAKHVELVRKSRHHQVVDDAC